MYAAALLCVLVICVVFVTALVLRHDMRAALPQIDGDLHVTGLQNRVLVARDEHGMPSLSASTLDDLLFAQGFVTAQDRLFQMDALRRHGAGELAELLGSSLVDHDTLQRTLRLKATAEAAFVILPADQKHQLEMYARGVNAFLASHADTLPVEFAMLHYRPAAWTPQDSLLIGLVIAQDLSTEFPRKLNREALSQHLPPELLPDLYPVGSWRDHPPQQTAIDLTTPTDSVEEISLDNSQTRNRLPPTRPEDLLRLQELTRPGVCDGCVAGSNNWAVSGARSASGSPLLSNDMHLVLNAPDIWYEAALHTPDHALDVEGFTLPGVPFVIVGRNAHVAWGVTVSAADVQDVLIEHVRGSRKNTEYERADGSWIPVEHHAEHIRVRGGRDIMLDVRTTAHPLAGRQLQTPIISDLNPSEDRTLSLAWYALDPVTLQSPYLAINTAPDAASLVASFASFGGPPLSLIYADAQHIGFHSLGRVPVRGPTVQRPRAAAPLVLPDNNDQDDEDDSGDAQMTAPHIQRAAFAAKARQAQQTAQLTPPPMADYTVGSPISSVPVDALDAGQIWSGYIPYDALPAVQDPVSGVVATANSRTAADDFHYFFTNDWADSYRVERIYQLLGNRTKLTPADMLAVQTDVHSSLDQLVAQRVAYAIDHASPKALGHDGPRPRQAADILRRWTGEVQPDSSAAAIVSAIRTELWPLLLSAQIARHDKNGERGAELAKLVQLYSWGESSSALEMLLVHTPQRWLPPDVGNWNDLLTNAAVAALSHAHAPHDLSRWRFSDVRTVEIAHPIFGSHTLLSRLLGVATGTGPQPTSGDSSTIKQMGAHFGPSERFTADLADAEATTANITTGQSGNPASRYFLDQFDAWLHGGIFRMPLLHPAHTHTLTLLP